MSVSKLIQALEEMPPHDPFDWIAFSDRLNEEFVAATTSEERSDLLAARTVAMEFVVRQLELHGEHLEKFTDACELEYKRLIVQETLVECGSALSVQPAERRHQAFRGPDERTLQKISTQNAPAHAEFQIRDRSRQVEASVVVRDGNSDASRLERCLSNRRRTVGTLHGTDILRQGRLVVSQVPDE